MSAIDRTRLVEEHLWLAEQIARRMARRFPSYVERSELHAAALLGLTESAQRFDPALGVPFPAYASVRMRGEILEVARSVDIAPRRLRRDMRVLSDATERLTQTLGRRPSVDELAVALDVDTDQVIRRLADVQRVSVTSLDRECERGEVALYDGIAPDRAVDDLESQGAIREAVIRLPEPLRSIIIRTHWHDDRLIDIAADMNVSFQRVAQYKSEGIYALATWLSMIDDDVTSPPDGMPGSGRRTAYCDDMWRTSTWRTRLAHGTGPAAV